MLISLTILLSSLLLGSMVFFAGIVTPSIFRSLGQQEAMDHTRHLFPRYYLWCIVLSGIATLTASIAQSYIAMLLVIVLAGFIYGRQSLMKKVAEARDRWTDTDSPQDKARYKSLHKRSVIINGFQILVLLLIVFANQVLYPR